MSSEASTSAPHQATRGARGAGTGDERWLDLIAGKAFPLNLADEFAALADLRPDAPISIVARHGKRGGPHAYQSLSFRRCRELAEQYASGMREQGIQRDRKSTRLNSSHRCISY